MTADEIVQQLDLRPHPEGGWFRETFRDPAGDDRGRSRSTAILYLLAAGDLTTGHRPHVVVPAGAWQSARPRGAWALVGCTVAPGFQFEGFELA